MADVIYPGDPRWGDIETRPTEEEEPKAPTRSLGRAAIDTALSVGQFVPETVKAVTGLGRLAFPDPHGLAAEADRIAGNVLEGYKGLKSERGRQIESESYWPGVDELSAYGDLPAKIGETAAEALPFMFGGFIPKAIAASPSVAAKVLTFTGKFMDKAGIPIMGLQQFGSYADSIRRVTDNTPAEQLDKDPDIGPQWRRALSDANGDELVARETLFQRAFDTGTAVANAIAGAAGGAALGSKLGTRRIPSLPLRVGAGTAEGALVGGAMGGAGAYGQAQTDVALGRKQAIDVGDIERGMTAGAIPMAAMTGPMHVFRERKPPTTIDPALKVALDHELGTYGDRLDREDPYSAGGRLRPGAERYGPPEAFGPPAPEEAYGPPPPPYGPTDREAAMAGVLGGIERDPTSRYYAGAIAGIPRDAEGRIIPGMAPPPAAPLETPVGGYDPNAPSPYPRPQDFTPAGRTLWDYRRTLEPAGPPEAFGPPAPPPGPPERYRPGRTIWDMRQGPEEFGPFAPADQPQPPRGPLPPGRGPEGGGGPPIPSGRQRISRVALERARRMQDMGPFPEGQPGIGGGGGEPGEPPPTRPGEAPSAYDQHIQDRLTEARTRVTPGMGPLRVQQIAQRRARITPEGRIEGVGPGMERLAEAERRVAERQGLGPGEEVRSLPQRMVQMGPEGPETTGDLRTAERRLARRQAGDQTVVGQRAIPEGPQASETERQGEGRIRGEQGRADVGKRLPPRLEAIREALLSAVSRTRRETEARKRAKTPQAYTETRRARQVANREKLIENAFNDVWNAELTKADQEELLDAMSRKHKEELPTREALRRRNIPEDLDDPRWLRAANRMKDITDRILQKWEASKTEAINREGGADVYKTPKPSKGRSGEGPWHTRLADIVVFNDRLTDLLNRYEKAQTAPTARRGERMSDIIYKIRDRMGEFAKDMAIDEVSSKASKKARSAEITEGRRKELTDTEAAQERVEGEMDEALKDQAEAHQVGETLQDEHATAGELAYGQQQVADYQRGQPIQSPTSRAGLNRWLIDHAAELAERGIRSIEDARRLGLKASDALLRRLGLGMRVGERIPIRTEERPAPLVEAVERRARFPGAEREAPADIPTGERSTGDHLDPKTVAERLVEIGALDKETADKLSEPIVTDVGLPKQGKFGGTPVPKEGIGAAPIGIEEVRTTPTHKFAGENEWRAQVQMHLGHELSQILRDIGRQLPGRRVSMNRRANEIDARGGLGHDDAISQVMNDISSEKVLDKLSEPLQARIADWMLKRVVSDQYLAHYAKSPEGLAAGEPGTYTRLRTERGQKPMPSVRSRRVPTAKEGHPFGQQGPEWARPYIAEHLRVGDEPIAAPGDVPRSKPDEMPEGRASQMADDLLAGRITPTSAKSQYHQSMTTADWFRHRLPEIFGFGRSRGDPMEEHFTDVAQHTISHVPIHEVHDEVMTELLNKIGQDRGADGFYHWPTDQIFLRRGAYDSGTVREEMAHAIQMGALERNKTTFAALDRLRNIALSRNMGLDARDQARLRDPHELVAGIWASDSFRRALISEPLSPAQAAIVKRPRARNILEAAADLVRGAVLQFFRRGRPGTPERNLLDETLAMSMDLMGRAVKDRPFYKEGDRVGAAGLREGVAAGHRYVGELMEAHGGKSGKWVAYHWNHGLKTRKWMAQILATNSLRDFAPKDMYDQMSTVLEQMEKQGASHEKIIHADSEMARIFSDINRLPPTQRDRVGGYFVRETLGEAFGDAPIGETTTDAAGKTIRTGKNKHIDPNDPSWYQTVQGQRELQAEYGWLAHNVENFPEWHQRIHDWYRTNKEELLRAAVHDAMDREDMSRNPDGSRNETARNALTKHLVGDPLNSAEQAWLDSQRPPKRKGETIDEVSRRNSFDKLMNMYQRSIPEFAYREGPFVALKRFGDHAVIGDTKFLPTDKGVEIEPGLFEFKNEADRKDYMTRHDTEGPGTKLMSASRRVYDKETGKLALREIERHTLEGTPADEPHFIVTSKEGLEPVPASAVMADMKKPEGERTYGRTEIRYLARYQLKFFETFDKRRHAAERIRELQKPEAARFLTVRPEPEYVRDWQIHGKSPEWVDSISQAMIDHVKKSMSYRGMSDAGKKEILMSMAQAAAKQLMRSGGRAPGLPREYVKGASHDLLRGFLESSAQRAYALARHQNGSAMRDALEALEKGVNDRKDSVGNEARRMFADELVRRVYTVPDPVAHNAYDRVTNRMLKITYASNLFGTSFLAVNVMEPIIIGLPILASKVGAQMAMRHYGTAYRDAGAGTILKHGFQDMWNAARGKKIDWVNWEETLEGNLRRASSRYYGRGGNPHLDEEIRMTKDLLGSGFMESAAVNEVSLLRNFQAGALDRGIDYIDRTGRGMINATEALNRAVLSLSAFRAMREHDPSSTYEQRLRFAKDAIYTGAGRYDMWNAPPIMNNPVFRPAFQFKKYALRQITNYIGAAIGAAHGDKEKTKQLAYMLGMQAMVAGLFGLPTEIFSIPMNALWLSGVSPVNWQDIQNSTYRMMAEELGPEAAEIIAHGGFRFADLNLSGRLGADAYLTFGNPGSIKQQDIKSGIAGLLIGAAGSQGLRMLEGVQRLAESYSDYAAGAGDRATAKFIEGVRDIMPIRQGADIMEAFMKSSPDTTQRTNGGAALGPEYSGWQAFMRGLGIESGEHARGSEQRRAEARFGKMSADERKLWVDRYAMADPAARPDLAMKIRQWNADHRPEQRIMPNELVQAVSRRRTQMARPGTELGLPLNRRTRPAHEEFSRIYNTGG